MNDKSIEALKKALAEANGAMARLLARGPSVTPARKAQLEMDARTSLATLAATIEREDVF